MEDRRAMAASLSDVASATSILLGVCLVVLLTLIAICRLLRLGVFSPERAGRCADGTGCRGDRGNHRVVARAVEDCLPAKVPEDESATSTARTGDQQYSSTIDLYLVHARMQFVYLYKASDRSIGLFRRAGLCVKPRHSQPSNDN